MAADNYVSKIRADQYHLWKNGRPLLGRLDMELTERCNNNCIHCCINQPAGDKAVRGKELSTGEIKEILVEAMSLGCLSVRFTGGEPLLRVDFEEIYLFARKQGLRVLISTNATLITGPLAELFSRIPPLELIDITVYGMKRKSYEAITRVSGSFKAAWRGISLLLEKKVPFMVKSALLPPNREEIEEFEGWAATIPWMDKPPSYSMFFELRARGDSEERNEHIKGLRILPEEGLSVLTRVSQKYRRDMREFCSKFTKPPGDKLFPCGAGLGGCVDAYGNFQPCLSLRCPDTRYELNKGSLRDALTSFFLEVREKKAENPDYLARCARCFLNGLCEQCPARSWTEHGTLDTPVEYYCEVAHAQARYLGLLDENENAWEVRDWQERIKMV